MYHLIHDVLVTPIWDFCGTFFFADAAFVGLGLWRALYKRGIRAVGPINASKPNKGGDANSWPHQKFKTSAKEYLARGWERCAYTKLDHVAGGDVGWMQALIWRDNKFVKLLATVYVASTIENVRRWVRQAGQYEKIKARLLLVKYQKHMGYVDRLDRFMTSANIHLRQCQRRYHRAIFFWMLAAMLNNIFVLFAMLWPLAESLKQKHESCGFGYRHWFQDEIGNALIEYGLKHASQERLLRARNKIA